MSIAGLGSAVALGLGLAWVLFAVVALWAGLGVRDLPKWNRAASPAALPRVSAIVAARDEQDRIQRTAERLLAQEGVDLDLIVVDDRSTDATPAILDGLARVHGRLRVLHVDTLPEGWLGKPHACHVGALEARGDWLLFTDADTWVNADVVARAIAAARGEDVEHLCLFPGEERTTVAARAALTLIMVATQPIPALVNRDFAAAAMGIGAFNLVRADAYRAVGGYERLRMEVLDDLKLGLILRRGGLRTRALDANRDLKIHWAGDLRGLLGAVEKNMFAVFRFDAGLAALGAGVPLALWAATLLLPCAAPVLGPVAFAPLLGMATLWIPALRVARRGRLGLIAGLLCPLAVPVMVAMIVRSTVKTLRQGGIRWRDTFYPLADLRRGRV